MPNLIRIVGWLPLPQETKTAWKRDLLDRAYERDIAAARKAKDRERIESLESDRQFELELYDEEDDGYITARLIKEARRLRVPVPHRLNEEGAESEHWDQGRYYGRPYLTRAGVSALREEIRKELKARHESRSHWIAWLSALTGILGAATGFIAVWFKK